MRVIYLLVIGLGVFLMSTLVFGIWLRIIKSKKAAKIITNILHLILLSMLLPLFYVIFNQSLIIYNFDKLLNIPSLPFPVISKTIGIVMIVIGTSLITLAIIFLLVIGEGLFAFSLTKKVVDDLLYKHTRNPMVLGLFLTVVGVGLLACSTFFTLWSLIGLIPVDIFFLKFIEERELEMRFGQPYREYKKRVPFLIPSFRKMTDSG